MRHLPATILGIFFGIYSLAVKADSPAGYSALIEQSGTILCSPDSSVNCDLSAVAWIKNTQGGELIFGNDKPPKAGKESSVFTISYAGKDFAATASKNFLNFPPFSLVSKFESMSITPDGAQLVAMTAFNRFSENDPSLDIFNELISWPSNAPPKGTIVAVTEREGVQSSITLRTRLAKAIRAKFGDQANYFKMEGLAMLPGNRIIFGIREIGQSYTNFDYRAVLLEGKYSLNNGVFLLDDTAELTVIRDFSENTSQAVGRKVGLSSIEYDASTRQLYILTSFEDNETRQLGAYLWVLPETNGVLDNVIHLVKTSDGAPFVFSHKAEGMAVLGKGRVFIIHDDDRNTTNVRIQGKNGGQLRSRKLNEAAFDILQICSDQQAIPDCAIQH
ncbi:MAG: hypothetical protein WC742_15280 [Gallionellaceae bacterium]|jgi:hypothetical protein